MLADMGGSRIGHTCVLIVRPVGVGSTYFGTMTRNAETTLMKSCAILCTCTLCICFMQIIHFCKEFRTFYYAFVVSAFCLLPQDDVGYVTAQFSTACYSFSALLVI